MGSFVLRILVCYNPRIHLDRSCLLWTSPDPVAATGGQRGDMSYSQQYLDAVQEAILRTVAYADVFDYPLTPHEIHRYLVWTQAPRYAVQQVLDDRLLARGILVENGGYVSLRGREHIVETRLGRQATSDRLWCKGLRYGMSIARMPFIRFVGVTGTLAVNNAEHDADIDYLVVVVPGRVWLARQLCLLWVYLGRVERVTVCPNYVISTDSLDQFERSFFTAHELAHMVPIYGLRVYEDLMSANRWARDYLPNAFDQQSALFLRDRLDPLTAATKRGVEWLLGGRLGDAWERRESDLKIRRLQAKAEACDACSAMFTANACKGHVVDHARLIEDAYQHRLRQVGLELTSPQCPAQRST